MGGVGILILADTSLLHIETWETVYLLLKHAELLVRQLVHEHLLCERRIARILRAVLDRCHPCIEVLAGDVERLTEFHRVKMMLRLVDHHHDVVGRLVINHQFTIAGSNDAPRGIVYLLEESVGVGILLVVVAHQLESEQAYDINGDNEHRHATNHILPIFNSVFFHRLLPDTLKREYQNQGEHNTTANALQPVQPVEETERLKRKEHHTIDNHQDRSQGHEVAPAKGFCRSLDVFLGITWQEQFYQIRLKNGSQCHTGRGQSWGIQERINAQSHQKRPQQQGPLGIVPREDDHEINIKQRHDAMVNPDAVKHQGLHQAEQHQQRQTANGIQEHNSLTVTGVIQFERVEGSLLKMHALNHALVCDDTHITQGREIR